MKIKVVKLIELIINYSTLLWLIVVSFSIRPFGIGIPEINDQYGIVYLIIITFTLAASILIIWRLVRPNIGLRILSIIISIGTIFFTYLAYRPSYMGLDELIRRLIFGF